MDEGEILVLIGGGLLALFRWALYYQRLLAVRSGSKSSLVRLPLFLAPLVSLGVLWIVLRKFASFDVQNDPVYLTFYMVLGAGWMAATGWIFDLSGISYRDDVAERGNAAASWALAGATIGATLIYIGANIGDGPGWWVVFFTAGAAAAMFFAGWVALELVAKIGETITVDRDTSAGVRVGALLLAAGLILGRASAGNWYGPAQAVKQVLEVGAGAAVLLAVGVLVERLLKPSPERPAQPLTAGLLPAAAYLGAAASWVSMVGWWT